MWVVVCELIQNIYYYLLDKSFLAWRLRCIIQYAINFFKCKVFENTWKFSFITTGDSLNNGIQSKGSGEKWLK